MRMYYSQASIRCGNAPMDVGWILSLNMIILGSAIITALGRQDELARRDRCWFSPPRRYGGPNAD